jgi:hypothetical protein
MDSLYTKIGSPAAFSSIEKLYRAFKKKDPSTTRKKVIKYLETQDTYTLHKVTRNKFRRRGYITPCSGHTISFDVAYMRELKQSNDSVSYLMFCLDLFSRYLTILPLKSLKSEEVCNALDEFLSTNTYEYSHSLTDAGQEFLSRKVQTLFKSLSIHHYTPKSADFKNSLCERSILTIKNIIYRYLTYTKADRYIDHLDTIVKTYNSTEHRGLLSRTPLDIHLISNRPDIDAFKIRLYKSKTANFVPLRDNLPLGSFVRLKTSSSSQNIFRRGFTIRNTIEIFKVSGVNKKHIPVTYTISDLSRNIIDGTFYRQELIPTSKKDEYNIEILKKRKRGKREYFLVRYIHYPSEEPVWISKDKLINT